MNVVLIDSDCKKYVPDEDAAAGLLRVDACQVQFLDAGRLPQLAAGCRCVLVTGLGGGMKQYHRALILQNPQVRRWVFCVLGVSLKSERAQLSESVETAMAESKTPYTIVFDESATLAQTAQLCQQPVREKKRCVVASNNASLAQRCAQALARELPGWDVAAVSEAFETQYETADVIVAAGERETDFELIAPQFGMGRVYAWISRRGPQRAGAGRAAFEMLTGCGWNLSAADVSSSDLQLEDYAYGVRQGQRSAEDLRNDENFVLWDAYGLPVRSRDHTGEAIRDFLERQCCFQELAGRIR